MNNYEYIIASLPDLAHSRSITPSELVEWIRSQCTPSDNKLIDLLEEGFDEGRLGEDFYKKVFSQRNTFIKQFFSYDLAMRNAKVRHINKAIGRPEGQDIFMSSDDECPEMDEVMDTEDILEREKKIDSMMDAKIDEINIFNYFDINVILGFLAKLHFVRRWLELDEARGREMFRKLVEGVRGTFKGVEYNEK